MGCAVMRLVMGFLEHRELEQSRGVRKERSTMNINTCLRANFDGNFKDAIITMVHKLPQKQEIT
jgi:hypothetical protein